MTSGISAETNRVHLDINQARQLSNASLASLGYIGADASIITDHLMDAALCGYEYSGLPKILDAAASPRVLQPRTPLRIVHETPISALFDGGNHIGMLTMHRATQVSIDKAKEHGIAVIGVTNSWMSGRSAYYMERVACAGLVGIQTVSASPRVAPPGGIRGTLGTNPIAFGFPGERGPLVVDLSTAAVSWTDLVLRARRADPLEPGIAVDCNGAATTDATAALAGAILPFGGSKGFALSFAIQALGVLAGSTLSADGHYGFLLIAIRPDLLVPLDELRTGVDALVDRIKATPRVSGSDEIRVPSERAFREREARLRDGIWIDRSVHEELLALTPRV